MGVAPYLLYQAVHKGRARLLGGWPPLSFWLYGAPLLSSPSLHDVLWGRTLLWGSPFGNLGVRGLPPPLHAVRWERTLLGGCLLHLFLARVVPLLPLGHAVCWERTLLFWGVPPFFRAWPARHGLRGLSPCPLLPTRGLRVLLGMGGPSSSWALLRDRAPAARCGRALLSGGSTFPLSPLAVLALGAGDRSGGALVAPLRIRFPSARGVLSCSVWGSPVPSLHTVGARCWVGVPPPHPPLWWPLTLGARDRSEGALSSVFPLSDLRAALGRQGCGRALLSGGVHLSLIPLGSSRVRRLQD